VPSSTDLPGALHAAIAVLLVMGCTPATAPPASHEVAVVGSTPARAEPVQELPIGDAMPAAPQEASREPRPRESDTAEALVIAGKPLVPARRFPGTVYGALVDPNEGQWVVDVIDFEPAEDSALVQAINAAEDRMIAELPAGHVGIPKGWAKGDSWTLVTRAGTVTLNAASIGVGISDGSGVMHLDVRLGHAAKGAKGPALALRGKAGASAPKLVAPTPVAITLLGDDVLPRLAAALRTKIEPAQAGTLRQHALAEKHVRAFVGRFPGGRTHAIFVTVRGTGDDPTVSQLLFARDDGTIEPYVVAQVFGELEPFAIIDLDGDGLDEIAYEDAYHEGWYFELVHWKQGRPHSRTLTGDGL
jgi:hypothetical protein